MSEEKLDQPDVKVPETKSKGKKEKKKRKNRLTKWFREMKSELKKVVWPTPKQILNNTVIVLVIVVISSAVIWVVDQAGVNIFGLLIKLGGA
ncbi:MAG: preprotein translocase subunit SecE [Clostridiales bacterium]|nr:preprotein translocase subunit SecE [Clostridiales bacterium]